jgi:hypothetical protein
MQMQGGGMAPGLRYQWHETTAEHRTPNLRRVAVTSTDSPEHTDAPALVAATPETPLGWPKSEQRTPSDRHRLRLENTVRS